MSRPVLLKIGGSILTDKASKPRFKKTVARRIFGEVAKMDVPVVVMHGAGSFGHPPAKHHQIGQRTITPDARGGVSEVLAACGVLHAQVVEAAQEAGLRPVSVPIHLQAESIMDELADLPVERIGRLLDEGYAPVLSGTIVRDDRTDWRVVSADELMAVLAPDLTPRLAIFASDVDGVFDKHPDDAGAELQPVLDLATLERIDASRGHGDDVTGRMRGKLERAFQVAAECPTWIVNGAVRGRVQDVLKGKSPPGTRLHVE